MASNSKIDWCDCTYQIVTGCTKISPGCQNCYAEKMAWRLAHNTKLPEALCEAYAQAMDLDTRGWSGIITPIPCAIERMSDELWRARKPRRVFVQSMGDLFHEGVSESILDEVFGTAVWQRRHRFLFLTKRPERMQKYMDGCQRGAEERSARFPWKNVWLGVTVCNQAEADEKIPVLLNTPAAVRFISVEPMLGPINLHKEWLTMELGFYPFPLGWVICGAETGPGARPMDLAWARDLRDQCKEAGVPFFFKSAGPGREIPADLAIRETQK